MNTKYKFGNLTIWQFDNGIPIHYVECCMINAEWNTEAKTKHYPSSSSGT